MKNEIYLTLEQQEAIASWLKETVSYPPDFHVHFLEKFGKFRKKKELIEQSLQTKITDIDECISEANELRESIIETAENFAKLQKKAKRLSKQLKAIG